MIAEGIAALIGDGSITDLVFSDTTAATVFVEALPSDPPIAVGVYYQPGPEADSGLPYDMPGVHILVRGDTDPRTAPAIWYAIYSKLHGLAGYTLPDGTYLVYALAEQSGPVHLQPDARGRYQLSMNLRTEVRNPTAQRTTE